MLLNLIIPLIAFGVVSLIGILITPFYINSFGYEGLGIISNSNAILQSLFFIGGAFTTVYARLYTKASVRNERVQLLKELNKLLTSLFFVSISVSLILFIYSLMLKVNTLIYYSLAFAAASIIIKAQSFTLIPFAKNKLYINSVVDSLRTLLRNGLFFAIFVFLYEDINSNAFAMLLSALIVTIVLMRIYPENNIIIAGRIKYDDNLKNSIWVCINQGGAYLFSFADVFLINFLLGHYIGGTYALLIQIPVLMKSISSVAQGAISSFIIKLPDIEKHNPYQSSKIVVKIFVFYAFFISSAFILLSEYRGLIFKVWLGEQYDSIITIHFGFICYMFMVLSIISTINIFLAAWGYFTVPAKMTLIFSISSVGVVLFDFFFGKLDYMRVFAIIYGFLIIKNIYCYFYFFVKSRGNSKEALINLFYIICVVLSLIILVKISKIIFDGDEFSLLFSVVIILIVSLPMLNMFKNLNQKTVLLENIKSSDLQEKNL